MKPIETLGLALVAALVAMALVGAGSASATTLCEENANPCPEGKRYPGSTAIAVSLAAETEAVVTTSGGLFNPTIGCDESAGTDTLSAASGEPLPGSLTPLAFDGCLANTGGECEVDAENLPYKAALANTGAGNGSLTLSSGGSGEPFLLAECEGLPTCDFGAPSIKFEWLGGEPAVLRANGVGLTGGGGFGCPPNAKLFAAYLVTAPSKAWVEKEP
jgi:hypothetical protein